MLAKKYNEYKHKIAFPVLTQPKLNGIRTTTDRHFVSSRSGKDINASEQLLNELVEFRSLDLDGELYKHGLHLDQIKGIAKSLVTKRADHILAFHVFDYFDYETTCRKRLDQLSELDYTQLVNFVPYNVAKNDDEVQEYYQEYLALGYEGAIIRNPDALYQECRTKDLLKLKPALFATAKIIAINEGKNNNAGKFGAFTIETTSWICNISSGLSAAQKEHIWKHKKQYIGKLIKMTFPELTSRGRPHQPVFCHFIN